MKVLMRGTAALLLALAQFGLLLEPALATETSTLMSTQNADNVVITGGSIDGVTLGANTALASPLGVPSGGTGRATLTNHGVLVGAGASAMTQITPCTQGYVLLSQGASADPGCNIYAGENLITNGGFALDQQYEGTGPTPSSSTAVRVVDRFYSQWVVSTSGAGNPTISQAAIASGNTVTPKELKISANSTPGTTTPAAYNFITYQSIEGNNVADLQMGTANAESFTISVWLKSSISSGTYDVFVQNGAANRSYSHDCVTSTTTWTLCTFTVPGDITGTWNRTRDSIGMVVGVTAACGSTFQEAANTWAGTTSNCTAAQTALTNTASATLEMAALKVERGSVATPYVDQPAARLLADASRFYFKTFTQGTAPATNAGTGKGEACTQTVIATSEPSITLSYPEMYNATLTTTLYNPGAANANFRDETGSADVTAGTAGANVTSVYLPTGTTVATIAHKVCVQATVDAGF